jgi:predicted oxidoreductase (fatty acid repression mutant protein)
MTLVLERHHTACSLQKHPLHNLQKVFSVYRDNYKNTQKHSLFNVKLYRTCSKYGALKINENMQYYQPMYNQINEKSKAIPADA